MIRNAVSMARFPCALLLSMSALLAGAAAQQGFQHVVPADTLVFLGTDDVTAYGASWSSSSLGTFWSSDAMAPTRASIEDELAALSRMISEELGADPMELPDMLAGPLAFAMLDLRMPDQAEDHAPGLAFCVLADVGERRDDCKALLDRLGDRVQKEAEAAVQKHEEIGGLDVTSLHLTVDGNAKLIVRYAFHEQTLVAVLEVGEPRSDVFLGLVDGLDGRRDTVLADSAAYRSSLAAGDGSGVRLYADVGRIVRTAFDGAEALGEFDAEETGRFTSLGLRDLGVMSMRAACDAHGSKSELRLDWPGDGWIQKLLRHACRPGDFQTTKYVPAGVRSFTAVRLDLPGLFDSAVKMLINFGEVTPGDVVEMLTKAEEELGFNPREDLLELLTGEFVVVADGVEAAEALPFVEGDNTNFVAMVGLTDGPAFTTLLDGVIRKFGFHVGRKSEEFLGFQVHHVPLGVLPVSLNYAVLDDMAVVSLSPTLLRDILRRRGSPDLPAMIATEKYRDAVARVGATYGLIGFSDMAEDMKSLVRTLHTLPGIFGADAEDNPMHWLATLPLPDEAPIDAHFKGGTASVCWIDENGITFQSASP